MEENKEEEHLNESLETQLEHSQNEITPTQDLETIHSTQESEPMEVHHHAHDPAEPHHKKNWKSYFWEFLMLFLAVFCGFLAEYQLEHTIENQREKKYIISLVKDIELDIASLEKSYELRKAQISYFDSLSSILKRGDENQMNDFYFYARHLTRSTLFRYHDRTIQQLKNSGNLRLIRNTNVADSITIYDNEAIKTVLIQQDSEEEFRRDIAYNLAGKILDANVWDEMNDTNSKIKRPVDTPSLVTKDQILINEFHFRVVHLKATLLFTNRYNRNAIRSANNLIALIKKEYHLK